MKHLVVFVLVVTAVLCVALLPDTLDQLSAPANAADNAAQATPGAYEITAFAPERAPKTYWADEIGQNPSGAWIFLDLGTGKTTIVHGGQVRVTVHTEPPPK